MKRKTPKGVVSIFNDNNRIRLRWRYQNKRYSINLASYSKTNLLQARKLAVSIEHDIALDCFDSTLGKYKPNIVYEKKEWSSLVDLFIKWVVSYRNRDVDSDTDYYLIKQMLIRWGDLPISEAVKKFNAEKIGPKTYNTRLRILKRNSISC